jgi:hypothetical protein
VAKWFQTRKEDLPKNLQEMEPEALSKAVDDAQKWGEELVGAREKLKELDTLKAKSTEQQTEVERMKARIQELEGNQDHDDDDDDKGKGKKRTGPQSVFLNEDEAFAERLGPLHAMVTQTGAMTARSTAREAIGNSKNGTVEMRIWNKYQNEINTLMTKEHPTNQINPTSWVNAFIYVKGLHSDDLMELASKKTDVFAEVGSSSGNMHEDNKDNDKLSPQELDIAKKFKMTPEKYLERKKGMKFSSVT